MAQGARSAAAAEPLLPRRGGRERLEVGEVKAFVGIWLALRRAGVGETYERRLLVYFYHLGLPAFPIIFIAGVGGPDSTLDEDAVSCFEAACFAWWLIFVIVIGGGSGLVGHGIIYCKRRMGTRIEFSNKGSIVLVFIHHRRVPRL